MNKLTFIAIFYLLITSCSKTENATTDNNVFKIVEVKIDNKIAHNNLKNISLNPLIEVEFDEEINQQSSVNSIELLEDGKKIEIQLNVTESNKKTIINSKNDLKPLTSYTLVIRNSLRSKNNKKINKETSYVFITTIDNKDKFERITTEQLLTKVQSQTFKYFWDFAHPNYGMIRERNTSNDIVTTGGTGFGLMAIITGIERGFITKNQGIERTKNIVAFLKIADKYHGAFSHWYNGNSGKTIAFSTKDNGADLVETALLFQGLLTSRNYFNDTELNTDITNLYNNVEWNYFRNNQNGLYWHWSSVYNWEMNLKISGWNEALITYILAAGSPNFSISLNDYTDGWAKNGAIRNNSFYYGIKLPLGPDRGGPLFLSQYSFLGINPFKVEDNYANYESQVKNHTLINRAYCVANPKNYVGYNENCWGLTASDNMTGYDAHSPTNDNGVIAPTAALSSIPYTPDESIQALEFFYYKLGDKLWGEYGFYDSFSLDYPWFATSFLAINQGPIIIGIENYRSGLLWENFMKSQEVKNALTKLNFTTKQ